MELRHLPFAIIVLCLGFFLGNAQTAPAPERDLQMWNDVQIRIPFTKDDKGKPKTSLLLYGTLRVGRDLSKFVDERAGLGLEFKLNKTFTLTPAMLFREAQPWPGRKESERRLRLDVGIEKPFSRVVLRDRNRIEYRMRSGVKNSFRYRNRLQLTMPLKRDGKEFISPFVADEVFYDFREQRFTRNEFTVGFGRKISSGTSVDIYYTYQRNRSRTFKIVNVLGVSWRFDVN